ncbi:type VII secretion target [Hamadaea sp. NPDC050747]|uniref:type VII secretion target n=1 Tax=Hamadaea sp. NPDC050747 TaxID=3155789 RepID=UPI0033FDBF8C
MAGDGQVVQFPIAVVQQHAGTVQNVASAMETAKGAIQEVTMSTEAYGQLCQFLPAILSPIFMIAQSALSDSVASLEETAQKLRTAATSTQTTDLQREQATRAITSRHPGIELAL